MPVSTQNPQRPQRTVAILGVSYGGARAAMMLGQSLPDDWRVVAIDRQSHMNHVYVFPRYVIVPEHAPKAFVPYRSLFAPPPPGCVLPTPPPTPRLDRHVLMQGHIVSLQRNSVTVLLPDEKGTYDGLADDGSDAPPERLQTIDFDYCIYALGSMLPAPCDIWGENGRTQLPGRGSKSGGVQWMKRNNEVLARSQRICVVGAGALGIQFSSDIKDLWPEKEVTLIHSGLRVLPRYPEEMHEEVMDGLDSLGVKVILGERVVVWPESMNILDGSEKTVTTDRGTSVTADYILACTGPLPHSELMRRFAPQAIAPNGRIRVKPTTQVDVSDPSRPSIVDSMSHLTINGREPADPLSHIFVIGDCANTTAILAGHTAFWQGEVAARNVQRMVDACARAPDGCANGTTLLPPPLETYIPGPPAIKVTLGIHHYVMASGATVTFGDDGHEDLQARAMWPVFGAANCTDDQ